MLAAGHKSMWTSLVLLGGGGGFLYIGAELGYAYMPPHSH